MHTSNQRAASRTDRATQPVTTVSGPIRMRGPRGMRPAVPFIPNKPLKPARDADRPSAVTSGRDRREPARDRGGRPAGRTARGARRVPRVPGHTVQWRDADVEAAELRGGGLAEQVRARRPQTSDHRRVVVRDAVGEHDRGLRVRPAGHGRQLLHRDGHASEREVDVGRGRDLAAASTSRWVNALSVLASIASRHASNASIGFSSPRRNASTSEQASPNHGSGMRTGSQMKRRDLAAVG